MKKLFLLPALLLIAFNNYAQRPDGSHQNNTNNYDDLKDHHPVAPGNEAELNYRHQLETMEQEIRIYPNPAKESISIFTGEIRPQKIIVVDLTGQIVLEIVSDAITSNQVKLDLSPLKPGIYFVQLDFNQIQMAKKIVVCE